MNEQMNHSVNQQTLFMAPIEEKYSRGANRADNWFHKGHIEWDSVPESMMNDVWNIVRI